MIATFRKLREHCMWSSLMNNLVSVVPFAQQRGCRVVRVKGQRVASLRKYRSSHAKTDAIDTDGLARMPSFGEAGTS